MAASTLAHQPPNGLDLALLGFLREQPAHAYELYRRMEQASQLGLVWRLKQSHLYALIGRLETAGYVRAEVIRQGTRPPRRLLELTAAGQEAFTRWAATPVARGRDFRQEFLAKLYFASCESPQAVRELVALQRTATTRWLGVLRAREGEAAPGQPYTALVLRFRMSQIEAILGWLDECERVFTRAGGEPDDAES